MKIFMDRVVSGYLYGVVSRDLYGACGEWISLWSLW